MRWAGAAGTVVLAGLVIMLASVSPARSDDEKESLNHVLNVFVEGGDYVSELRKLRGKSGEYPELVATLTDYVVFEHGILLDLLFEESGPEIAQALEIKVKSGVECLAEFQSICQPSLADRNAVILSSLRYYEDEVNENRR